MTGTNYTFNVIRIRLRLFCIVIPKIALGSWLRERYINELAFLPPTHVQEHEGFNTSNFNPWPSVYYISNNFTRCIQSADALLLGLYPPDTRSETSLFPIHCDYGFTWLTPNELCARSQRLMKKTMQKVKEEDDLDMVALKQKLVDYYDSEQTRFVRYCRIFCMCSDCGEFK